MTYALTKQVCQLNEQNIYVGQTSADLSPAEADDGIYLMPAGTIDAEPPKDKKGFIAKWTGSEWEYIENHIGEKFYSTVTKLPLVISELGAIPKGYTAIPPESELCEWGGDAWVIPPEKMTVLLQEQREIIRTKINQLRDEKTAGGVYVASIGKWFDSDDKARANVIEMKAAFDVLGDEIVPWTTYENDVVMMDHGKMKALFKELKDSKLHNHQTATQHKLALEQSTDPLNYDYSTGWSKTYADQEN
nr:MAG TPA: tail fiber assembly protein [Caudoviricetes sp.]